MASVVSRNLFDLLSEEPEVTTVKEKEVLTKEPAVAPKKVDKSRAQPKEARIRFEYPQRGGHKAPASNRSEDTRSAPRDRNVGPRLSGRREEGGGGSGGGGGGGGDYPTRNSRGARPNDRGRGSRGNKRGREHDRHSGTGKYDSEKKENQAWGNAANSWENDDTTESKGWSGNKNKKSDSTWENTNNNNSDSWGGNVTTEDNKNWGTAEDKDKDKDKGGATDSWNVTEEPTENNNWQDPQPTDSSDLWASGDMEDKSETKKEDSAAGNSAPVPEPEEVVKTYDEYLAEKAQKSLEISLPEFRKPNEGADDSQWKHAVPLEKDDEDEYFTGKEQSYRNKSKKSKTKNYLEIAQTFDRPGGGSSRGRGRGRGSRGGRGRDDREGRDGRIYDDNNRDNRRRGGSGRGVNLDDQRAFPSLGASS